MDNDNVWCSAHGWRTTLDPCGCPDTMTIIEGSHLRVCLQHCFCDAYRSVITNAPLKVCCRCKEQQPIGMV